MTKNKWRSAQTQTRKIIIHLQVGLEIILFSLSLSPFQLKEGRDFCLFNGMSNFVGYLIATLSL